MTANVALTDTFDQWRVKTNEVVVMTQSDGMSNFIKSLDTTNSTSNTTGSIITAGGVGIAKCVNIGEDLKVWGDITCVGDTTVSGNLVFGDADSDQVSFSADINSNMIPNANVTFNLGNTTMQWANTWTGHLGVTQKADSGKAGVTITGLDVDQVALDIAASQTSGDVVNVTSDALTTGKVIDITADALTTGSALYIDSDSSTTDTRSIASIIQNHASATGATALTVQADAGRGVFINTDLAAGGYALEVDSEQTTTNTAKIAAVQTSGTTLEVSSVGVLTGKVIDITADAATTGTGINMSMDALTTGSALAIASDSSSTGTRNIASIIQDHSSASGSTSLYLRNDHATADALKVIGAVTVGVDDTGHDVKFFGATASQYLLWDESGDELVLAGDSKLSFHDAAGGENIIASADGHLEVNAGTTLDITAPTVDINAATLIQVDGEVKVGVAGTGHDVYFYGDTSGKHLLWDQSGDELLFATSTKLSFHDAAGGENILASADGHLEVNAGTTLDITAPTVDINAATLIQVDGEVKVGVAGTGHDVYFYGDTSGKHLLWDQSGDELLFATSAKLSFHDAAGGENILASADGHLEVNAGTTLDITAPTVDINAATLVQIDGAVSVGVDDTGHDVKLFGATAGKYSLWDQSEDELQVVGKIRVIKGSAFQTGLTAGWVLGG